MSVYSPLIDSSYFTGPLTIGQVETSAVETELDQYIKKYEVEFLLKLMGYSLFKAFVDGMKEGSPADKWKRMAYGLAFTLDANKVKTGVQINGLGRVITTPRYRFFDKMQVIFRGFVKPVSGSDSLLNDGLGINSPIAQYVYYWWNRYHATASGGAGESVQQVQNGQSVVNAQKMIAAWNDMSEACFLFYLFLDQNISDYPEYDLDVNARFHPGPINEFNL